METTTGMRLRCRNPRCLGKLKTPVESKREAFCCSGCFNSYFRKRCLVCEQTYSRAVEHQRLCGRRKCRRDYNRNPAAYTSPWGPQEPVRYSTSNSECSPPKTPDKTGTFWRDKSGRGWRWIASEKGHDLIDRYGRLAARLIQTGDGWRMTLPKLFPAPLILSDLEAAKHQARNAALWALPPWRTVRMAKTVSSVPLNLVSGYQFRNAPKLDADLVRTIKATELIGELLPTLPSPPIAPTVEGDGLDIPQFLRREFAVKFC